MGNFEREKQKIFQQFGPICLAAEDLDFVQPFFVFLTGWEQFDGGRIFGYLNSFWHSLTPIVYTICTLVRHL